MVANNGLSDINTVANNITSLAANTCRWFFLARPWYIVKIVYQVICNLIACAFCIYAVTRYIIACRRNFLSSIIPVPL